MSPRLNWFGVRVQATMLANAQRGLPIAAEFLRNEIVKSMKLGGGKGNVHRTGTRKMRNEYSEPIPRSQPGEPPFVQTGRLRQSIVTKKVTSLMWKVGTAYKVGWYLEKGTKPHVVRVVHKKVLANVATGQFFGKEVTVAMAARPFVKPALQRNRARLMRIIKAGKLVP